jgi:hypothetical protein
VIVCSNKPAATVAAPLFTMVARSSNAGRELLLVCHPDLGIRRHEDPRGVAGIIGAPGTFVADDDAGAVIALLRQR